MPISPLLKRIVSIEYLFAAVLLAVFFVTVGGYAWWWIVVGFVLFDISMIGYLVNPRVGAIIYNIGHSFIGPVVLAVIYIFTAGYGAADSSKLYLANNLLLAVIILWLFHICVDRALGFGLKHSTSFHHTHLGHIGKARKK